MGNPLVDVRNGVLGNFRINNFNSGQSASHTTFWAGDGTWKTPSATASGARTQRSIIVGGDLPIVGGDNILNINAVSDLTPIVPLASGRSGVPLTFKNLTSSHSQTITRTAPDTFDGTTTYILAPGASLTLVPYNDGVNSGYAVE